MEVEPDRADERDAAEKGYFFQTGGAIRFSDAAQEVPGYAVTVMVADRYGFVAYSDLAAVYIAFTNQLLKAASSEVKRPPVLDPATVCVSKLPVQNVAILSLSADQLLLACVAGSTVQVYSLPALLHHQSDVPVHSMALSKELMQFSWCPESSARDSTSFLAVSSDRVLLHGSLVSGSGTLAEGVECACWSPDGRYMAYSSGSRLVVTAPDWKETAFMVNIPAPEGESGDGEHVLDSINWVSPSAIAASSLWYNQSAEDEQEGPDAYVLGITWDSWAATATAEPQGLTAKLTSYVNLANVDEYPGCGQHEWPYLRSVYVPAWKLLVHSHRKAFDEHVRLMELGDEEVFALEQSETKLVAAVPISEDGENFVIGMALDYSNRESMYHPMSDEKPDVPASCILLVSTLDGVLRLYRLANFKKEPGLARPPLPVPSSLPQNVTNALAAARNAVLEEESETSVSSPSPQMASFMQHLASTQSSTSGAALTAWSSSGAATPPQQQQQRLPAVTATMSQHQPPPEDAAATVALPSEDESDLEDSSESDAGAVDMGASAGTAEPPAAVHRGASAIASDEKSGDDGWGSSEEGEESQEATSQPSGARAALPTSALAKTASAPTFGVTTSTPSTTITSIFGSPTAAGTPSQLQPFGAASSTPAFSFATAGTGQNSSAKAITTKAAAGPFGGSFGFGGPTISASPPPAPAASSAPAFGILSTASSVAASLGTMATTPAFGKSVSAPSFVALDEAAPVFGASAATPPSIAAAASGTPPAPTVQAPAGTTPVSGNTASGVVPASVSAPVSALPSPAASQPAFGAVSPFGTPPFGAPAAAAAASSSSPATGLFGGVGSAFSQPAATATQTAASKGAFAMPPVVSAAEFQASPAWQGPRAGYTFTTGTQGTGYYSDKAPKPAQAVAPQPTVASSQPDTRGTMSAAAPAASQPRPQAAGGAASAARRAAVQQHHQQQEAARKLPVQVPAVKVAAPKPQMVGQGQEVADAEAAFLQSLHEVSTMSAQLQQFMNRLVPKDVDKWDLAQHTQQLRKQAAKLNARYKQQKQSATKLTDSWDEVNRQQAALTMFHPNTAGTAAIEAQMPLEPALAALRDNIQDSFEAITSNMEDLEQQIERWQQTVGPLGRSPAATGAQWTPLMGSKAAFGGLTGSRGTASGPAGPFQGMGLKVSSPWGGRTGSMRPMGANVAGLGLNHQSPGLGRLPTAAVAAPSGGGGASYSTHSGLVSPSHHNAHVELLYKVVSAQQDTSCNLAARINTLAHELERLGVVKTDTDHMGGRTLGKWGDEVSAQSLDDDEGGDYGCAPGVDELEYERSGIGTHATPDVNGVGLTSGVGGSAVFGSALGARGAVGSGFGLDRATASKEAGWGTPAAAGRSATRAAGDAGPTLRTPGSQQQQGYSSYSTYSGPGTQSDSASKLHWVTPGSSGARKPQPASSSSSSQQRRQLASSSATTSSTAWQKFATELSSSTGKSAGGSSSARGVKSRVRTTVATPLPYSSSSRSTGRRRQQQQQESEGSILPPPRPPSPLQISAAAAATPAAAVSAPSAAFTFPGQPATSAGVLHQHQQQQQQQQLQGFATPAVSRLPGKLSFSPVAASPATPAAAAAAGAVPTSSAPTPGDLFGGLSPVPTPGSSTSPAAGDTGEAEEINFFMEINPLYDRSPGAVAPSPIAAVPPPTLQLGAARRSDSAAGSGTAAAATRPPAAAARPPAAAAKARSSQLPEPHLAAAASHEHKVYNRQASMGSTGSSPPPVAAQTAAAPLVKPKPVAKPASKATTQPPEPPPALLAAAQQAVKHLPQQTAKPAAAQNFKPSSASLSAAAAAANKILASAEMQDQPQGEAATAGILTPVAAKPAPQPKVSSQPPEPPMALTQQAQAALNRMAAAQAAGTSRASTTTAPATTTAAKPKASSQPPEPPGALLQAASQAANQLAQQQPSAPAAASRPAAVAPTAAASSSGPFGSASAFGAFGSSGFGFAASSAAASAPSAGGSIFNSLSGSKAASGAPGSTPAADGSSAAPSTAPGTASNNAADALSAMLGGQGGGGSFGGFGALGLGGGTTSPAASPVASASAATSAPFGNLSFGTPASSSAFGAPASGGSSSSGAAAAAPGFGAFGGSSSGASGVSNAFGSFGFGGTSSAQASSSSASVFGSNTAFGSGSSLFGGQSSSAPSASNPFGALVSGTNASSSAAGTSSSVFGSSVFGTGSTSSSAPFGTPAAPSGGSLAFGAPAASTPPVSSVFGASGSAFGASGASTAGFGQPAAFGVAPAGTPAVSSAFGQPATPGSPFASSAFGTPASAPSGPSVFGGFAQCTAFGQSSTPTSAFGQLAASSQTVPALGQPTGFGQTPAALGQSSAFGQPAAPASAFGAGSSTFGQPSAPAAAFGQASTPAAPFGQPSAPSSPPSGSVFGSAFGQPATPGSGGSGFGAFGGAAASGGGFGAFGAPSGVGGFAAPNPFGVATTPPQQQQQQPNLWAARR